MTYFPFKTVILCLVLMPVLYILTLTACRNTLETQYTNRLQNSIIGDPKNLLDGKIDIEKQIAGNIQQFQDKDFLISTAGLDLDIKVTAQNGKIIFPTAIHSDFEWNEDNTPDTPQEIARKNYKILSSEPQVSVLLIISHGSALANTIQGLYTALSLLIFYLSYRHSTKKAIRDRQEQATLINSLKVEDQQKQKTLDKLTSEREHLFENIRTLNEKYQNDHKMAKINENEMFNEILSLEEQLNAFIELKEKKDVEIAELKSTLNEYERRKSTKSKRNEFDFLSKRFAALYKNLSFHRKALTGLAGLTDDQQIKAEETIHQLDRDPDSVIVKRKVFSGKKNRFSSFEVLFSYNGRLYFRRQNNLIEVIVIGTKNTQLRDMEFLHNLKIDFN